MATPQDQSRQLSQPAQPQHEKVTHPFRDWVLDSSEGQKSLDDLKTDLVNQLVKAFPQGSQRFQMIPGEVKVLFTVSLDDESKDPTEMLAWLKDPRRPAYIDHIDIVGCYPATTTTKVMMTMPLSLYSVLPEDPAYIFIDYIRGGDFVPL